MITIFSYIFKFHGWPWSDFESTVSISQWNSITYIVTETERRTIRPAYEAAPNKLAQPRSFRWNNWNLETMPTFQNSTASGSFNPFPAGWSIVFVLNIYGSSSIYPPFKQTVENTWRFLVLTIDHLIELRFPFLNIFRPLIVQNLFERFFYSYNIETNQP